MSGLVVIFSASPDVAERGPAALSRLRHRDEFESSVVESQGVWLGVCGLPGSSAVGTDDDGDGRPDDPRLVAAIAGDILNAPSLARDLGLAQASPIRILLAGYRRWGAALFARLEGAFSAVVHDAGRRLTVAGTDPVGVGRLHVVTIGDDVLLASEAKAFLADARFRATCDEDAWASLVTLGRLPQGSCLFRDVRTLKQGCRFEFDGSELHEERQWDPREACTGLLSGEAYTRRMADTVHELAEEVFAGGGPTLLPLTGGLDSRLLAAGVPWDADVVTMTFGDPDEPDVGRAAAVARTRGWEHRAVPREPDYLARHAGCTAWLAEGCLEPSVSMTSCQMDAFSGFAFVASGLGGDLGRDHLTWKVRLLPFWPLLRAGEREFEQLLQCRLPSAIPPAYLAPLFGAARAAEMTALRRDQLDEHLRSSRGLTPMQRLHVYELWEGVCHWRYPMVSAPWIGIRTPYLTRRFAEAVFAGADDEVIDERARLRLILHVDRVAAAVPWTLTRLPLRPSVPVIGALRQAARLWRAKGDEGGAPRAGASWAPASRRAAFIAKAKDRVYSYGDRREDWLRTCSRAFVEEVLLGDRFADRGLVRRDGVVRLLDEQWRGASHSRAVGDLVLLELWHRFFVDRDPWSGHSAAKDSPA